MTNDQRCRSALMPSACLEIANRLLPATLLSAADLVSMIDLEVLQWTL